MAGKRQFNIIYNRFSVYTCLCSACLAALASQLYSAGRAGLLAALTIGPMRILMGYN